MKIYINKVNEDWIVDKLREDFIKHNKEFSTRYLKLSHILWIMSPWTFKLKNLNKISHKKILYTIHHLDLNNFDREEFKMIENKVDFFHVISEQTYQTLRKFTNKKIYFIPWWVDDSKYYFIENKMELRQNFGFKNYEYLVGSFQRDTEGSDLVSPKLIKGPDIFIKIIREMFKINKNLKVVLAGHRRQYIINELEKNKIPYKYFQNLKDSDVNKLYNILDLYLVSSRLEGGPQAISECAVTRTPIISSKVGIAELLLDKKSIFEIDAEVVNILNAKPNIEYAFNAVETLRIQNNMKRFESMFREIYES